MDPTQRPNTFDYVDASKTPTRASRFLRQELNWEIVAQAPPENINYWGFGNLRENVLQLFESEVGKLDSHYARDVGDDYLHSAMERVLKPQLQGQKYIPAQIL